MFDSMNRNPCPTPTDSPHRHRLLLVLVALLALLAGAFAQDGPAAADGAEANITEEAESGRLSDTPPGQVAFGVSAGFPSYQTAALTASLQSQYVGVQLKGSWTPAGPFIGAQLRGYPPLPIPVPLFVGLGVGFYGPNVSYHAAIGGHVPLDRALRLDFEAGVANVPLLGERGWAPHVALGVSYAIAVDLTTSSGGPPSAATDPSGRRSAGSGSSCAVASEPDRSLISGAVSATVDEWLRSAQATYGSVYTDLNYSYRIANIDLDGDNASVRVAYSGSVREIFGGAHHQASGEAAATFRWNGCRWSNTGVSY